jgi:predicted RNase H-like HicB family nuclease
MTPASNIGDELIASLEEAVAHARGERTASVEHTVRVPDPDVRDTLAYPVHLEPDPAGGFVVTFPDFGYGVTEGDSREEALGHASDLLETLVASAIADNEDLPAPSPADGRPLVAVRGHALPHGGQGAPSGGKVWSS